MKKVITYGTFDLFHEGHRRLLERAKALGDCLIVGVTGDSFDCERGKLNVRDSLAARIEAVKASGYADEIIVEEYQGQKISDILRFGADIFAIGSDWTGKYDYLSKYCEVVYLERTKGVSSTALRESGSAMMRIGVVSDSLSDGGICAESYFVSGLEVSGVYMPEKDDTDDVWVNNATVSEAFRVKYDLANAFCDTEELHRGSDIVYVHTRRRHRFEFAAAALKAGRHVICDFPLNKPGETDEIYRIAKECGRVFAECVPLAYLRTFQQLNWQLLGGAVGQILSLECAMPVRGDFRDSEALAAYAIARILGVTGADVKRKSLRARERYDRVIFSYENAVAACVVSDSEWLKPGMTILGTDGRVDIPGAWWNMSYFRLDTGTNNELRHYSFNMDGSGLRYLLSEMTQMIADGRTESVVFRHIDARQFVLLLEQGELL